MNGNLRTVQPGRPVPDAAGFQASFLNQPLEVHVAATAARSLPA